MKITIPLPSLVPALITLAVVVGLVAFVLLAIATQGAALAILITTAIGGCGIWLIYTAADAWWQHHLKWQAMTDEQKAAHKEAHRYDW